MVNGRKNNKFPKGFFKQPRPTISTEKALKDVIPVKWNFNKEKNKKVILISSKEKGIIR